MNSIPLNMTKKQQLSSMLVVVEYVDGPVTPSRKSLAIGVGEKIRVGRLPICELSVRDPSISGKHFSIQFDDNDVLLMDLGSRNGTLINGLPKLETKLIDGDQIRVGKTTFQVTVKPHGIIPNTNEAQDEGVLVPDPIAISHQPPATPDPVFEFGNSMQANADVVTDDDWGGVEPDTASRERANVETVVEPESSVQSALDFGPTSALLKVTKGNGEEDEIRIQSGQVVVFGSSRGADFTLANANLRSRHFKIKCQKKACWLSCFKEQHPVSINGQVVFESQVFHGDVIVAGMSEFSVSLTGSARNAEREEPKQTLKTPLVAKASTKKAVARNVRAECFASEFTTASRVEGSENELPNLELMKTLQGELNAFVLVDFFRMGDYLGANKKFRLSNNEAVGIETYLIPIEGEAKLADWVDKVWGSDCGVFIFSKSKPDELRNQLSEIEIGDQSFCDVCWPSILRIGLWSGVPAPAKQFLAAAAYMVSETELPSKWSVFCSNENLERINQFGVNVDSESEDSTTRLREKNNA